MSRPTLLFVALLAAAMAAGCGGDDDDEDDDAARAADAAAQAGGGQVTGDGAGQGSGTVLRNFSGTLQISLSDTVEGERITGNVLAGFTAENGRITGGQAGWEAPLSGPSAVNGCPVTSFSGTMNVMNLNGQVLDDGSAVFTYFAARSYSIAWRCADGGEGSDWGTPTYDVGIGEMARPNASVQIPLANGAGASVGVGGVGTLGHTLTLAP